jgi:hypothetical protein
MSYGREEEIKGIKQEIDLLVERRSFLARESAISADASVKFALKKQIEDIDKEIAVLRRKIEELGYSYSVSDAMKVVDEKGQKSSESEEDNPCRIPDITQLTGKQTKLLIDALVSAFPSVTELAKFVRFELDKNLNAISGSSNIADASFDLITHFESEGKLRDLISKACEAKSDNPQIKAFIQSLNQEQDGK